MKLGWGLILVALLGPQDDPSRAIRELIEKLRSDSIEERDDATKRLKSLGPAAKGELEKASRDRDSEVARRASFLLRAIDLRDQFSPQARQLIPSLEERLATGGDAAWTEAFRTLAASGGKVPADDLRKLAPAALRGAATAEDRRTVCDAITRHRIREALPELFRSVKEGPRDDYENFIRHTLRALDCEPVRRGLIELLEDKSPMARNRACHLLTDLGAAESAPRIVRLLDDPDATVRQAAYTAIADLDAKEVAPQVARYLARNDPTQREQAAMTLGRLEARESIPAVANLLKDPSADVRETAVRTLTVLFAREAAPQIEALLQDADLTVRSAAAWALALMGARASAPRFVPLLNDPEPEVRIPAAWGLGRFRHREAIPGLIQLLSKGDSDARVVAAQSLGAMEAREAADALIKGIGEGDRDVRSACALACGRLRLKEAAPALLGLLKTNDCPEAAAWALGRLGAAEALPLVLRPREINRKRNQPWSPGLAMTLRGFRAEDLLPAALKLVEGEVTDRELGAFALRALRSPKSKPALLQLLKDREKSVRAIAARAAGETGLREAIPDLLAILNDEDSDAQGEAGLALARLGAREALPALRVLAREGGRGVEGDVVRALEIFGDAESRDFVIAGLCEFREEGVMAAARWLCREGRRVVLQPVLDEAEIYTWLNGLRRPEAWKRLCEKTLPGDLEGTLYEVAERIAADAGFELEWRFEDLEPDLISQMEHRWIVNWDGTLSAADALVQLIESTDMDYEAIVEQDRIRIIPWDDAERFWERWGAEELKRK